jgi:hypothetical protein
MTGRDGHPLPVFRLLNWAYLRDRVALNSDVTGLFDPPSIASVWSSTGGGQPGLAVFPDCCTAVDIEIQGANFLAPDPPDVILTIEGDPTPNGVFGLEVDPGGTSITAMISPYEVVLPGFYDVEVRNSDGQQVILVDGLEVQHP